MRRIRGSAGEVLAGLRLPQPREAPYDALRADEEAGADAMTEVEQRLAELAGVARPAPTAADEPDGGAARTRTLAAAGPDNARRLLHVAELVTFGAFVLLVISAMLAARFGTDGLRVHELPFAGWGLAATLSALTLARLGGRQQEPSTAARRRAVSGVLLAVLLGAVTGVVASADGVAGPAWVLFLPVVLVAGAVGGPVVGLLVGAGAAAGVYSAAGLSHTLDVAGVGRMVVLLPAFPAVGWSAGALSRLARDAAAEAHDRQVALERDVARLTDVLERVAEGDLTVFPSAGGDTDPVMTKMAVAFADSLLALRRLVRQMDSVADQLASNAVDLAGSAGQEAAAVGQQAAAVAETTTTIEELAATAASIADTAVRVAQCAGHTRGDVDEGIRAVELSNESMERIAGRVRELDARADRLAERIGTIATSTHLIDELARQTTILAVNASIEAARAADHGRGFANVAQEVGQLATRAREATARIDGILGQLQAEAAATAAAAREGDQAVLEGVARQDDVVVALSRIASMVDRTTVATREITEATRQQRFASDAVVTAMATVTGESDRYRDGSRRHAGAAERLRDLAETLRAELRRFKVS